MFFLLALSLSKSDQAQMGEGRDQHDLGMEQNVLQELEGHPPGVDPHAQASESRIHFRNREGDRDREGRRRWRTAQEMEGRERDGLMELFLRRAKGLEGLSER